MNISEHWQKLLDIFGLKEINSKLEEQNRKVVKDDNKVISIYQKQGFQIKIYRPDAFRDVQGIADELMIGKPVILDLQGLKNDIARRIIDFISGAVYGIDGSVQKITDKVFLFTPENIKIDGDIIKKDKSLFK